MKAKVSIKRSKGAGMSIFHQERKSDSPYIELVTRGQTISVGSSVRPAESHWHLVIVRVEGKLLPLAVGSLSASGVASWGAGAEILWIKFKLGMYMPYLPPKQLVDKEILLPEAGSRTFWLHGSAWQFPHYDTVETFVNRLVRDNALAYDPVVASALQGCPQEVPARTMRHRFLHTTGLSQNHIQQITRAQRAAAMLQQGIPILDTVFETGYFDQPHLTKSLKRFVGMTPAQLLASPSAF